MKKPRIKENYVYIKSDNQLSAGARFAGNWVWGHAKCHPDDEYNEEFGMALAAARCNAKIANLRWKRATERYRKARIALAQAEKEFVKSQGRKIYIKVKDVENVHILLIYAYPFPSFTKKRSVSSSSMRSAHNAERNTRSA